MTGRAAIICLVKKKKNNTELIFLSKFKLKPRVSYRLVPADWTRSAVKLVSSG